MARLPKRNKILAEDFPKQDFMPKLLEPINSFSEDMVLALNKGLTFQENMASETLTVTIDGVYPLDLKWTNKSRPIGAWIINCREVSGAHTTFTTALYLDWEMTASGSFRVNNIAGLTASSANKFTTTIIAIVG